MSVEICVRVIDDGELRWERKITYRNEYLFGFPEYRTAVFSQAERMIGDRLATELGSRLPAALPDVEATD